MTRNWILRVALIAVAMAVAAGVWVVAAGWRDEPVKAMGPGMIVVIDVGEIGYGNAARISKQIDRAKQAGAKCVVLRIESTGGANSDAQAVAATAVRTGRGWQPPNRLWHMANG